MKNLKGYEEYEAAKLPDQSKVSFTKQTMKLDIDWAAAKDFDVCYYYERATYPISNDENGYNYLIGFFGSKLANINKFKFFTKKEIEEIYSMANLYGGSPKPLAFTVKKGTKLEVNVHKYNDLTIKIMDGSHSGKEFKTSLMVFRTYLVGKTKDENLVISKYKIFLNGEPLKSKYYTNIGRVKLALLSAFGFLESEYDSDDGSGVPYYIADSSSILLNREDCKNVKIMRYDNNSKVGVPIDFDVLKYYDEYLENKDLKKNAKKYNL